MSQIQRICSNDIKIQGKYIFLWFYKIKFKLMVLGFINNLTRWGSQMEMAVVNIGIVMGFFFFPINCVVLVTKTARNRPPGLLQLPV